MLDSQNSKCVAGLLRGPPALRRIAEVAMIKVREESTREVDPLAPRAQRQLLLFRQSQLVGRLRGEHETALMMLEEGEGRILRFRDERNLLLDETVRYLQRTAAMLVPQADKLSVRNPGFASSMVKTLHDWATRRSLVAAVDDDAAASHASYRQFLRERNKHAWAAQLLSGELVGRIIEPIGVDGFPAREEHLSLPPVSLSGGQPDLLGLLFLLQLVELTCQTGGRHVKEVEAPIRVKQAQEQAQAQAHAQVQAQGKDQTKASSARPRRAGSSLPSEANTRERTTTGKNIDPRCVLACAKVLAQTLLWLRDWREQSSGIDDGEGEGEGGREGELAMLLVQTLRSLRCLLTLPQAVARLIPPSQPAPVPSGHEKKQPGKMQSPAPTPAQAQGAPFPVWSWGLAGFTEETLIEHLQHWTLVTRCVRYCLPRSPEGEEWQRQHARGRRQMQTHTQTQTQAQDQDQTHQWGIALTTLSPPGSPGAGSRMGTGTGAGAGAGLGAAGNETLLALAAHKEALEQGGDLDRLRRSRGRGGGGGVEGESLPGAGGREGGDGAFRSPRSLASAGGSRLALGFDDDNSSMQGPGEQELDLDLGHGHGLGMGWPSLAVSISVTLSADEGWADSPGPGPGLGLAQDSVITALTDPDNEHDQDQGYGPTYRQGQGWRRGHGGARYGPQPHDFVCLEGVLCFGSAVVVDLLQCCAAVTQASVTASGAGSNGLALIRTAQSVMNPFERRRREADEELQAVQAAPRGALEPQHWQRICGLLRVSLALSESIVEQYCLVLGGADALNFSAPDMLTAADEEGVCALQVATAALSTGVLLPAATNIMKQAQELSRSRLASYFVQVAYMDLLVTALGAFVQHAVTEPEIDDIQEAAVARRNAAYFEAALAEREKTKSMLGALADALADEQLGPLVVDRIEYNKPPDPLRGVGEPLSSMAEGEGGKDNPGDAAAPAPGPEKKRRSSLLMDAAPAKDPLDEFEEGQRRNNDQPWSRPQLLPPRQMLADALNYDLAGHIVLIMSTHRNRFVRPSVRPFAGQALPDIAVLCWLHPDCFYFD